MTSAPFVPGRRRRVVIVGGVAAGSSCATRVRRLDEEAEITVFEKGPYVSFANCGLPYHISGVIPDESSLLLVSPERFQERFDIDVRILSEVVRIDREGKRVQVLNHSTSTHYWQDYDSLVLAPGAATFMPPIAGLSLPGVFAMRTVPDSRKVRQWLEAHKAQTAVVVGAGFIGLEVAENLHRLGLTVHVVEMSPRVLPSIDGEMARLVGDHLEENGVKLHLGEPLQAIEAQPSGLKVITSASTLNADIVILGLGVRPRTRMAIEAGLEVGALGGLKVDTHMRTNDPDIYAVGDVTEEMCAITGLQTTMPLAGPANRQGRMAADAIVGRSTQFRGVQGTAICGLFESTVAVTGLSEEKAARTPGLDYRVARLHPSNHVSYYPGASTIHLKVIYEAGTGRVLGASAFGKDGIDKRIDVLAMAIQMGSTVFDLEQAELCYAPQFGAAKDPVNMAGMIGANNLRGDLPVASWRDAESKEVLLVDVREDDEWASGHVAGAQHLPLSALRERLDELPGDQELLLYCRSGKRSYDAVRALLQRGYHARSISGGLLSRPDPL